MLNYQKVCTISSHFEVTIAKIYFNEVEAVEIFEQKFLAGLSTVLKKPFPINIDKPMVITWK